MRGRYPAFDVNYGDLDVCTSTGRLFVVSSNETTVAELTPTGQLVGKYPLPAEITNASGIALEGDAGGSAGSATRAAGSGELRACRVASD